MIKINERFSIERTPEQWILYDKVPSGHRLTKDGYVLKELYYTRLSNLVDAIFDRLPIGAESLKEMHDRMVQIKADVYRAIMGG